MHELSPDPLHEPDDCSRLVVLSHLRWDFVWQRPQQLISRLADRWPEVWFVEEPMVSAGATRVRLRMQRHGPVNRVWLDLPEGASARGFDSHVCDRYAEELAAVMPGARSTLAWLYTPMAL